MAAVMSHGLFKLFSLLYKQIFRQRFAGFGDRFQWITISSNRQWPRCILLKKLSVSTRPIALIQLLDGLPIEPYYSAQVLCFIQGTLYTQTFDIGMPQTVENYLARELGPDWPREYPTVWRRVYGYFEPLPAAGYNIARVVGSALRARRLRLTTQ